MKTIVELYEDKETEKIINKYARMNFIDKDDLRQESFLHILDEYGECFDLNKYVKKIAMRLKREEQRERVNSLYFDERYIDYSQIDKEGESWHYYFSDDDEADLICNDPPDLYWRGCSPEMNKDVV